MTKEELEKIANEYEKENLEEVQYGESYFQRPCVSIAQAFMNGANFGMKKVCEICEQHMLEEHPNACGCAFRRLGNEYCWEFK